VDLAAPVRGVGAGPPVEYDRLLSVFVGNLPFDVKVSRTRQTFTPGYESPWRVKSSFFFKCLPSEL
jgi:hypothetical protein